MNRDDSAIVTALTADEVQIYNAVELRLDDKNLRFWTGYGKRAIGDEISVSDIIIGDEYMISTVGDTFFPRIGVGGASAVVGQFFYATDVGTGTGKVKKAYAGIGSLMAISGLTEMGDLSAQSAQITFSGIPSDLLSLALQEPYQRRECIIYFGVGDEVAEVFSGEIDAMDIQDSAEISTISLNVTSRLIKLERANERRYTAENHKARYPNDTFFDSVADLQDTSIAWGRTV